MRHFKEEEAHKAGKDIYLKYKRCKKSFLSKKEAEPDLTGAAKPCLCTDTLL